MTEFAAFARMGFRHVADPAALDHLLFLVALVAPYRPRDWRHLLLVASAFTAGHSLTLALAVLDLVRLPAATVATGAIQYRYCRSRVWVSEVTGRAYQHR